jgi:hypothetical protein
MEALTTLVKQIADALAQAGIPYQVVGSFAVYLHMMPVDPEAAHVTPKVEIVIDVRHLGQLASTISQTGLAFKGNADGLIIRAREVEPGLAGVIEIYTCVWPRFPEPVRSTSGILVAPIDFVVQEMLKRKRLEDQLLIKDLDWARLITPEIVSLLPQELQTRLAEVRATK